MTLSNLAPGTMYRVHILTHTQEGQSTESDTFEFETLPGGEWGGCASSPPLVVPISQMGKPRHKTGL